MIITEADKYTTCYMYIWYTVGMTRILIYTLNKQQKLQQKYVQYLYWDGPECNIESRMVFHTWKNYDKIHTTISLQGGSCVKAIQVLIQQIPL